jgi:hypothetical protein
MKTLLRPLALVLTALVSSLIAHGQRPPTTSQVGYDPGITIVEGDQPLSTTVSLAITSPSDFAVGTSVTITPKLEVLILPAGVDNATALSYVTLTPTALTFTGPNQTLVTTVEGYFPPGIVAGAYSYKVTTPGWPTAPQDPGAFLNATVYKAPTAGGPPTVKFDTPVDNTSYVYQPAVGPLVIPVSFKSAAPSVTPITAIDADVDGRVFPVSTVSNPDGTFTSTANLTITAPGVYSLHARATNNEGTATDTSDITITVSAPPPTVSIATPLAGSSLRLPTTGALTVPYSFTGLSSYGGITSLTATLNGSPVTFTPGGLGTLTATGSGNFSLTLGGTYELVVTATDANGSATARTNFTVLAAAPAPTVVISQPLNGATYTRVAGSAATLIPYSYTGTANTGFTITGLTGALNGSALTPTTTTGLNTQSATSTGTLSITGPGTYTLSATANSLGTTASTSVTFTVTETQPPRPGCTVNWLPPISLGNSVKSGSKFAIKFELYCKSAGGCGETGIDRTGDGDPDFFPGQRTKAKTPINKDVVIAVTDITNGTAGTPQLFRYSDNPNVPGYTIQGNDMYHVNFPIPQAKRRYRVEVYDAPANLPARVLGTREFTTK